ncbi:hypothetical protein DY000_02057858 [Brassica cretica]|uniref:Uncharacterized protein n=1 Tax=Brassica cretica TaxID=69181 RepID=A0ABQ7AEB8_BRACR|nr:hypothetical protein DY000_02057858 [Brassica cretica]
MKERLKSAGQAKHVPYKSKPGNVIHYRRNGNLSAAYDLLQSLQDENICLPVLVFNNLLAELSQRAALCISLLFPVGE